MGMTSWDVAVAGVGLRIVGNVGSVGSVESVGWVGSVGSVGSVGIVGSIGVREVDVDMYAIH